MRRKSKGKYEGFSFVEMLLTIVIIGAVMLISSVTLTSLIKVSSVASNKIRARNESEFVLELVRRTVRNSNPSDVLIFNAENSRTFDPVLGVLVDNAFYDMQEVYSSSLEQNEVGNEIHFRPYGYQDWICLGFFKSSIDSEKGYILRTTSSDLYGKHETCFGNLEALSSYLIVLNSDYVNVNDFNISYTIMDDFNYTIRFDIESQPVDWYLGKDAPISRTVFRQGIVSTEGLIW